MWRDNERIIMTEPINKQVKELKACPWCQHTPHTTISTSPVELGIPRKQAVLCLKCEARGPERNTYQEAREAWNGRK